MSLSSSASDNWVAVPDGGFCLSEDNVEVCIYNLTMCVCVFVCVCVCVNVCVCVCVYQGWSCMYVFNDIHC